MGMYHHHSAFYGLLEMEEAATKPSEDEIKFDETEHRREDDFLHWMRRMVQ